MGQNVELIIQLICIVSCYSCKYCLYYLSFSSSLWWLFPLRGRGEGAGSVASQPNPLQTGLAAFINHYVTFLSLFISITLFKHSIEMSADYKSRESSDPFCKQPKGILTTVFPASLATSAFSHEGQIRPPPNSIQQTVVWASADPFIWRQRQLYWPLAAHMWWYRQGLHKGPSTSTHTDTHPATTQTPANDLKTDLPVGCNLDWIVHFLFFFFWDERRESSVWHSPCASAWFSIP